MKTKLQKLLHHLPAALLALFVFSAAPPAVADDGEITKRTRKTENAVRVVTANLRQHFAFDYDTGDGWKDRRELCRDVLAAQDADIICFQECSLDQIEYLKKAMAGYLWFGLGNAPGERNPFNAILYSGKRFKKANTGAFWLSDTPEIAGSHIAGSRIRFVNWILLKDTKTGRDLMVWNTHLDHQGNAFREKQIGILLNRTTKISPQIPQILTGDFNTSADNAVIKVTQAVGWIDSYTAVRGPGDPGRTAHGFRGEKAGPGKKIDFIFANKCLKPTAAEIISDSRNGRYPSDHYFVSAELEYAETPLATP